VVALEREAQRRYQSKLDAIEKSLEETNNRINEISRRSGVANAKTLVITPEVQKEIDQFQKQAEKLVEERRAIRRGLSEEVNTLGRWLQILNLLIGPALAGLAGFIYHLVRRRPQVS
jgi:DNA repair ATPase RecN